MKCRLCNETEADFKGSHVIPHFIIKSMVNEEGSKVRDKEISFTLGQNFVDNYFGRSVSPDKIKNTLGRELSESDKEKNINPYTKDNFLCTNCEKRIGIVESYYSMNGLVFHPNNKLKYNNSNTSISILFWYSILWRISVTNFYGFALTLIEENKLQFILNIVLARKEEDLIKNAKEHQSLIDTLSYAVLIDNDNKELTTNFYFAHPSIKIPYCLIINNYILFYYFKRKYFGSNNLIFFGYETLLKKKYLNPTNQNVETLIPLTSKIKEIGIKNLLMVKQKQMVQNWSNLLSQTIDQVNPKLDRILKENIITETIKHYVTTNTEGLVKFSADKLAASLHYIFSKFTNH